MLLANGAVPDQPNSRGELPIDVAKNDTVFYMLKEYGDSWTSVQSGEL